MGQQIGQCRPGTALFAQQTGVLQLQFDLIAPRFQPRLQVGTGAVGGQRRACAIARQRQALRVLTLQLAG